MNRIKDLHPNCHYASPGTGKRRLRSNFMFAVLVGLLFCSLATLETTELLRLTDDTSNDFSILGPKQESSSAVDFQSHERQPVVLSSRSDRKKPDERAHCAPSSRPTKESLHLHCVLRT
jgi:hypothetical protein